jgi:N-acyl homoserine lactone hydrolase
MALKIHALHVGTLTSLPMAALTYQRGYDELVDVHMIMFLITGGDHPVVVDTGTDTPEATRLRHGRTLVRPPDQEPVAALAAVGVDPAEVGTVINTHLHWDHCSNNSLFPNARIMVQKSELQYAVDPLLPNRRVYERQPDTQPAWIRSLNQIETISGDVDLLPNISVVHLPGHSPGSQGVVVSAGSTTYLIAGDCVSYYENWDGDDRIAHIPTGGFTNMHDYMDSFAKIERLGATVIPSHDPRVTAQKTFE